MVAKGVLPPLAAAAGPGAILEEGVMMEIVEQILTYAGLGLIVGFGYYGSMAWIGMMEASGGPAWAAKLVGGLRLGAAIVFFLWLASIGATQILSAFIGFLVGRQVAFGLGGLD